MFEEFDVAPFRPPELCVKFFAVFQRFEYALKKHKQFLMHKSLNEKAIASWDEFGNSLGEPFFNRMKSDQRSKVLFNRPVKKQIINASGECDFEENPVAPTKAKELFESIRTVRNNLFHGGKSVIIYRDEELIGASLFVLGEALLASDLVMKSFRGY